MTSDALHTVRANLNWLVTEKKAQYIAVIKRNQPLLHAQVRARPGGRYRPVLRPRDRARPHRDQDLEGRPHQPPGLPHARQAIKITRRRKDTATARTTRQTVYAVTSLTSAHATAPDLARWSASTGPSRRITI